MSKSKLLWLVLSVAVMSVSVFGATIPDSLQEAIDRDGEAGFFVKNCEAILKPFLSVSLVREL